MIASPGRSNRSDDTAVIEPKTGRQCTHCGCDPSESIVELLVSTSVGIGQLTASDPTRVGEPNQSGPTRTRTVPSRQSSAINRRPVRSMANRNSFINGRFSPERSICNAQASIAADVVAVIACFSEMSNRTAVLPVRGRRSRRAIPAVSEVMQLACRVPGSLTPCDARDTTRPAAEAGRARTDPDSERLPSDLWPPCGLPARVAAFRSSGCSSFF